MVKHNGQLRASINLVRNAEALCIIRDVCKRFEVSRRDVMGYSRQWVICWPRFIAMKLIYESMPCRQADIALLFGRTPQAITHALRSVQDLEDTSARARSDLGIMRLRLGIELVNEKGEYVDSRIVYSVKQGDTTPGKESLL